MAEFLVDANILIGVFRGNDSLAAMIDALDFAIDTTVYVEVIQGSKNKAEVHKIEQELRLYPLIPFDGSISSRTIYLIRRFSKSHGLLFGDAVIAATCLEHDLTLVTFNRKDFRFIDGLKLSVPKS